MKRGQIVISILLVFVSHRTTGQLQNPDELADWSCSFNSDFCAWTSEATKAAVPAGPLTDLGWRIYSPNAGDDVNPALIRDNSTMFAYLESGSEMRSELSSPFLHVAHLEGPQGLMLSFSYFHQNRASMSAYLVRNNTYQRTWVYYNPDMLKEDEGPIDLSPSWVRITQCLPRRGSYDESEFRLSFVGEVYPNSSLGLSDVKVVRSSECASSETAADDSKADGTKPTDQSHPAWKFLIIVSLFLCFGALILATLVIVFGGKTRRGTPTQLGWTNSGQNFKNAAFQFRYRRLDV